jgi:hypothetical protein
VIAVAATLNPGPDPSSRRPPLPILWSNLLVAVARRIPGDACVGSWAGSVGHWPTGGATNEWWSSSSPGTGGLRT